jgi:hypothetical protein
MALLASTTPQSYNGRPARKFYLLVLLFAVLPIASYSQLTEICNNGVDDDFDGFIDCYDGSCANDPACDGIFLGNDATCQAIPPQFPKFTMAIAFSSPDETANHLSRMVIGDYDRDGMPEIATMNRYTKKLYILRGNTGAVKYQAAVNFEPYWEIATANLDNDNCAELFFIGYLPEISHTEKVNGKNKKIIDQIEGIYMFAYDCQLNFLWRTVEPFPGGNDPINYGIADFDGDGLVEIYAKDEIYDAKTGVRLVKSTASDYSKINGGPVAINMLGDAKLELVVGLTIYDVNLNGRTLDAGSLTVLKSRNDYFIRDEYNATSVADYNLDGFPDVIASGSTGSNGKNTTVFFWDVTNNTIKTYSDPQPALGSDYKTGWKNGTGRLNIADLDGDGKMNVSYVSGRFLYALNENFGLYWRATINEETSGYTGCTLFDFNGDGKAEIVYRDERFLYIINGTDGTNYQNPQPCISRTNREYPIVADVNADGSTEICVTCGFDNNKASTNFNDITYSRYSHVRVFKSAAEPWVPARRVWNQHGYYVVNVNDDLTIPKVIQPHHLVWSTGSCTTGPNRPLNKFLNQSPFLNSKGCPTYAAVNLSFSSVKPVIIPPQCPDVNFTVSLQLTNLGDVSLTGSVPISFYTSNPKKAGATWLKTINVALADLGTNDTFDVNNLLINGTGSDSLYIVLNDAGTTIPTPISLPNGSFFECDYTDNVVGAGINPLPVDLVGLEVTPNNSCTPPNNGAARAYVAVAGGAENTADYNFYWFNGASAGSIATANFTGPIYSGIAGGTYTVFARHKTSGCNSDTTQVIVTSTGAVPKVNITIDSHQLTCVPPNGKLSAVVVGGNTGYTFAWYDVALNPLGITGPVATNLSAGNYFVIASRAGCSGNASPATIDGPQVPDVSAAVLTNVADCSNLNAGSVQADALVGGVVQNPANYTFNWYFYDNITGARGSILPAANGSGSARTGLAAGYYQVTIKDNNTGCLSLQSPIVHVLDLRNAPTVTVTEVTPQTSCDPAQPNGVLTAVAVGAGLTSPNDFTFEWFKGDNTLPVNKVLTVSGVKGETLNKVSGGGVYYTVKVTTAKNCTGTNKLIISENVTLPVITLTQLSPNSVCNPLKATNPNNGSIKATVTLGASTITLPDPNYSFTWHNGSTIADPVIAVTDPKNPILTGLKDGSYTVVVSRTDVFCTSAAKTQVVAKATVLPALSATTTGSHNCDALLTPDGTATVAVTNPVGTDAFTYQWYNGNIVGIAPLGAANNGTSATAIKLGGPVSAPHAYTALVLNTTSGCENSITKSVSDNSSIPVLSFTSVVPNSTCSPATSYNGSLTVQVNNIPAGYVIADYVFTWKDATPAVIPGFTSTVLNKRDAGTYTVTTVNTKTGCTSAVATNQVPNLKVLPILSLTSTGSHNCTTGAGITPDGTATATVTNPGTSTYSYLWSAVAPANPITVATNSANQALAVKLGGPSNAPNQYSVKVTNNATGCESTGTAQVADLSAKPTMVVQPFPNTVCDKTLVLPAPGQFNGHADITSVNKKVGTYAGPASLSYKWYNVDPVTSALTANVTSPTNTTTSLTLLNGGRYAAQVSIAELGCVSDPVISEVPNNPTPVTPVSNVTPSSNCSPGLANGKAELTAPLGANFTYEWYTGTTADPTKLVAGATNPQLSTTIQGTSTFTAQVTNRTNGCRKTATMTVVDAKVLPVISLSMVSPNTSCNGTSTGILLATVLKNGVALATPFTIAWSPGGVQSGVNGQNYTKLGPGTYSAKVTETATGCQSTSDSESITNVLVFPTITATITNQTKCSGAPNGKLTATLVGGNTYTWHDGTGTGGVVHVQTPANSGIIDQLASANYTVEASITSTGCKSTKTFFVPDNLVKPTVSLGAVNPVTKCNTPNGSATASITVSAPANYDLFYAFTSEASGATYPTDPAVIKASADSKNILGGSIVPSPAAYSGMVPGYLTTLVVDKNTFCESTLVTKQIVDNTVKSNITVVTTAVPGLCNGGLGGIDPTVTPLAAASYTYEWYTGTPTNNGSINFFSNPPAFSTSQIYSDNGANLGVNHAPADNNIGAGTYTLVVYDPDGCGTYNTTSVPTLSAPTISITPTHVTRCDAPNGELDIVVTSGAGITGYSIEVFSGNDATGVSKGSIGFSPINTILTVSNLAAGPYFITVVDGDSPACPLSVNQTIIALTKGPVVTIDQVLPNTSCDTNAVPDGQVKLTVNSDAVDLSAKMYYVSNISPLPVGFALNPAPGNIIGTGASGQTTGLITGFKPQVDEPSYTITVIDDNSKCLSEAVVVIPNAQDNPAGPSVIVTSESLCAPSTNGSARASVAPLPDTEFDFEWYSDNALTNIVNDGIANPQAGNGLGTGGELLDHGKIVAPATWQMGSTGQGSGSRVFFVRARRNATATTGVGCYTDVVQVTIPDMHVSPNMNLTGTFNTFCAAIGGLGDGKVVTAVDADPSTAGQQNSVGGFDYSWTNANAALSSPQLALGNNLTIPQLFTGSITVTATNKDNQCQVQNSVDVDQAPYFISITSSSVIDQRICTPDGQIDLTSITVDESAAGTPNIVDTNLTPLTAAYDFKWYRADPATPGLFTVGQELKDGLAGTGAIINEQSLVTGTATGQYAAMAAGTYYVVATRKTTAVIAPGCPSIPFRVEIQDNHANPVPALASFSNTSCLVGTGEGSIKIGVTDNTSILGPNFTYSYTWSGSGPIPAVNPGTGDGDASSADGDNDVYIQLPDGIYNLSILNNQSGCQATASVTVAKNVTPIFVQTATTTNQIICGPDGSITVSKLTLNDTGGATLVSGVDFPMSDFEFDWTRSASAFSQTTPGNVLDGTTYNTAGFATPLGFDTYTVVARRILGGPGQGCQSAPFVADVLDRRIFPIVTMTPNVNTACDPAFFEGQIEIDVTDATVAAGPAGFTYVWDVANPQIIPAAASPAGNNGNGDGTDGDEDNPKGLADGTYNLSVISNKSGCATAAGTTIIKIAIPVIVPSVTSTDQVLCLPDGTLTISEVQIVDSSGATRSSLTDFPISDFLFTYDRDVVGNTVLGNTASTILDNATYSTIGSGSYFVVATRKTGGPGRGCSSPPFKVDINDSRLYPKLLVASTSNSACTIAKSNGSINADASEQSGANAGPYSFAWTLNGGPLAPPSTQTDTNNSSAIANASDGDYLLTATNTITSCAVTHSVDLHLDQTRSMPNVIDVMSTDPLDCQASGQAEVTKITLGSPANTSLIPPNANNEVTGAALSAFNYSWFQGSMAASDLLPVTTPCIGAGCPVPTVGLLPGSYFILVTDPTTDCQSGPKELVISDLAIIRPLVTITQTMKQVSCAPNTGTVALSASAVEEDTSVGSYNFTWYSSLDLSGPTLSGPAASNPNIISNLLPGDYSVEVQNTTTLCKASAIYIAPDEVSLYMPIISLSSQALTMCTVQDGFVLARVVDINLTYPFPLSYTADVYFGSNPNVSAPPDLPAVPNDPGFAMNFTQASLAAGTYTVRITDNNTSCTAVDEITVLDQREFPVVLVSNVIPNINCDPVNPNGVADVRVDGEFIGFQFDWYEGGAVSAVPVYTGAEYGKLKGMLYTILATNLVTGCTGTVQTTIPDGSLPLTEPNVEKLSDVTSCVADNGVLFVSVGTEKNTADYIFDWYIGSQQKPASDFVGERYSDLSPGKYSVMATSRITGCISPLKSGDIIKAQEYPDFDFKVQSPSCDNNNGTATLIMITNMPVEKIEWADGTGPFQVGPNLSNIASGTYSVTVTSELGCATTKDVEILPDVRPFNGISRNGDGQNEIFQIDCIGDFPNNLVKIYNRAGTLVFEAVGYDNSSIYFNGQSNKGVSIMGTNLPDGTYFYIIDKRNGSKPLVGYLELVD